MISTGIHATSKWNCHDRRTPCVCCFLKSFYSGTLNELGTKEVCKTAGGLWIILKENLLLLPTQSLTMHTWMIEQPAHSIRCHSEYVTGELPSRQPVEENNNFCLLGRYHSTGITPSFLLIGGMPAALSLSPPPPAPTAT